MYLQTSCVLKQDNKYFIDKFFVTLKNANFRAQNVNAMSVKILNFVVKDMKFEQELFLY